MRKVWWFLALLTITAVVYAQAVRIVGARGYGFAGPEGDHPADSQFLFHVHRVLRPDTQPSPVRGSFQFRVIQSSSAHRVSIHMPSVRTLEVDLENRRATFTGRATAFLPSATTRVFGVARVYVEDNTRPDSAGNVPDRLRVEFFAVSSSTPSFTYEGVVKRGDIQVFALNATP